MRFVSVHGCGICFKCACYYGVLKCMYNNPQIEIPAVCEGEENCNKAAQHPAVIEACSNPNKRMCENGVMVSWKQNGCQMYCYKYSLVMKVSERQWCHNLVEECSKCPDKEELLRIHPGSIFMCKNNSEIFWSEKRCDGRRDCEDGSDEESCKTYYCNLDNLYGHTWRSVGVNATISASCSLLNFDRRMWTGMMSRQCSYKRENGTIWDDIDYCSCSDNETVPTFDENKFHDIYSIKVLLDDIYLIFIKSVRKRQCLLAATRLMNRTINLYKEDVKYKVLDSILGKALRMSKQEGRKCDPAKVYDDLYEETVKCMETYNYYKYHHNFGWLGTVAASRLNMLYYLKNYKTLTVAREEMGGDRITTPVKQWTHVGLLYVSMITTSLVFLCASLILFAVLKIQNTTKIFIHKNFMIILSLSYAVEIIAHLFKPEPKEVCITLAYAAYYSVLAVFSWMAVEGINLILQVVIVFKTAFRKWIVYILVGYGFPAIISLIIGVLKFKSFEETESCLSMNDSSWYIKAPLAFLMFVNVTMFCVIFVFIIRNMLKRSSTFSQRSSSSLKAFVILCPLLGVSYIMGLFLDETTKNLTYVYIFVNGLMGVPIFLLHCYADPEVQMKLKKKFKRFRRNNSTTTNQEKDTSSRMS